MMGMGEKKDTLGIGVRKSEDMPEWFEQVVLKAELAEFSAVKGCMVIRPNGFAIWQMIQDRFNDVLKKYNVRNCYFPLFIPERFFEKEKEHAVGFNPEVAWVTHAGHRKLEEKLAIRPTSETIMCDSFKRWIRSYRDLPLKINQWCSVVRWETKATKLFLRSREFLWQEGHCLYEKKEENEKEVLDYLHEYRRICEDMLAVPVLTGRKTSKEKFAGAENTYTIEAFMPDGKFLQMGTTHDLGQGFVKSFGISYIGRDKKEHYPYHNSWGISTRMIGGLVMTHSDDKGLVLPPAIAEVQIVIVPIFKAENKDKIVKKADDIRKMLKSAVVDARDEYNPGWKFNEWELKGIPLRIEIGPKDIEKNQVILVRRDNGKKQPVKIDGLQKKAKAVLEDIQKALFEKAKRYLDSSIEKTEDWREFVEIIKKRKVALVPFCGDEACEDLIRDRTGGAGSRCIPFKQDRLPDRCILCDNKPRFWTYFGKSY